MEKTLFGWTDEQPQELSKVVLCKVKNDKYKACAKILEDEYIKTDLQLMADPVIQWLKYKKVMQRFSDGTISEFSIINSFLLLKKKLKKDYALFLACIFAEEENLRLFLSHCPQMVTKALKKLLQSFYVDADEFYKTPEGQVILEKKQSWGGYIFSTKYSWFCLVKCTNRDIYSDKYYNMYLTISPDLYAYFYRALMAEEKEITVTDLSDKDNLKVMQTEESIVKAYPMILNLYNKDILVMGKNNKVMASTIKKCAKQAGLVEFFPEAKEADYKILRSSFALPYLLLRLLLLRPDNNKETLISYQDLFNSSFADLLYPWLYVLPIMLPHLTGMRLNTSNISNYEELLSDLWDVITEPLSTRKWLSVDGILDRIQRKDQGMKHLHIYSISDIYFGEVRLKNTKIKSDVLELNQLKDNLLVPSIKGIFALLGSVGLLDLSFEKKYQADDASWVDGLRYIRLTNLGAYSLGYTNTYEAVFKEQNEEYFDIDTDRLILRLVGKNNPCEGFLNDVAKPIGTHRYHFSYESFLKNCSSKKEVENKIDFFKQFISNSLSPVWENFFSSMIARCHPLEQIEKEYQPYKLNPENKELIHLLSTDIVLKNCILRAEGYVIFVDVNKSRTFAMRLKALGFIL